MEYNDILTESTYISILVFMITFLLIYYTRRRVGIPPGPPLFPVIGNLLSVVGKDFFGQIERLRAKYGDVFALYIGSELTIFLNGHEAINEALIKKGSLFVKRPYSNFHKKIVKDPVIVFANDKVWKEQKTFTMKTLQDLCFKRGGEQIEHVITSEAIHLTNKLSEITEPFDINEYVLISATNVICDVLFKHRFEFGDNDIIRIMKLISESATDVLRVQLLVNCFPYLLALPWDILKTKEADKRYYDDVIHRLKPYLDINKDNSDTLLGRYRSLIDEAEIKDDKESTFTHFHLHKICYELIGTGSETTGTTLRWILLYLIREPVVQEKMFRVIEKELGTTALPSLDDKSKLPYVHAATLEGLRIANVAPLAVPHSPSKDLIFRGHLFPKNCTVIANLNSSLKDPKVWKDPERFRPERFLNDDQTEVVVPKEFIPFSLGPRSCLGETLARAELFLMLTVLIQKFEFLPEVDNCIPDVDGKLGLTWSPKPFKLRVRPRS